MKRYYSLHQKENTTDIYIYGDITSYPWFEGDTSSYNLSKELQELEDVDNINVYINSYGGEVKEGLAIYNSLKRHKAKITTIVDGFACSIASVIFAAGDERVINNTSLLMIHNAWAYASGDSNDLKKQAEDLEKITQASINAYMSITNVKEEELREMMNVDTWINSDEAIEMGFATKIEDIKEEKVATQSIKNKLLQKITKDSEIKPVANIKLSKECIEEIVAEQIQKLSDKLEKEQETEEELYLESKQKEETENKPLNMMKALFKLKGEK